MQIPWSAVNRLGVKLAISKPDSPSWSGNRMRVAIRAANPRLLSAVHQDFSGLITIERPTFRGEIIHLYGTGFGSVAPAIADGAPGPLNPLSRTVNPVACRVTNPSSGMVAGEAEVLFAGLAPGFVGSYQIDVRLAEVRPDAAHVLVRCAREGILDSAGIDLALAQ
jgi:uncharacterized protein (TIGR03437 family)